jgi:hypothetical protein
VLLEQIDDAVLEGDYDPETWDEQMAEAFGDDYYEQVSLLICGGALCVRAF